MGTRFFGEGNIGTAPEYREFAKGNDEPRRLLRLNVYFDNPIPVRDGYEDRGGFWMPVEIWNPEADHWAKLYQTGMRVLGSGLIDHIQKMTAAAMQIAEKKVWAHRS